MNNILLEKAEKAGIVSDSMEVRLKLIEDYPLEEAQKKIIEIKKRGKSKGYLTRDQVLKAKNLDIESIQRDIEKKESLERVKTYEKILTKKEDNKGKLKI